MLERLYNNKQSILKKSQEFFQNSSSLIPKIGCELEFFLFQNDGKTAANKEALDDFIVEIKAKKEQGASQIEVVTDFTSDLSKLCSDLENKKNFIQNSAKEKNLFASFAAQPFADDCGNALQFNISLHDKNDKNIFNFDEKILKNSAYSLLDATNSMMIFLAPKKQDYERFSFSLNCDLFRKGKFSAPVNLSFGADNRTCAIRIPKAKERRLEYRIASADADPWLCISAILIAMSKKDSPQFEQIFGNAFDKQYQLKNFCKNFDEAKEEFLKEENFIRRKFEEFLA